MLLTDFIVIVRGATRTLLTVDALAGSEGSDGPPTSSSSRLIGPVTCDPEIDAIGENIGRVGVCQSFICLVPPATLPAKAELYSLAYSDCAYPLAGPYNRRRCIATALRAE